MVFSSVPLYLDPPNWQQAPTYQHDSQLPLPRQSPPPGGGNSVAIRPGSMSERARLAKAPQPEMALKCPRCESTNTKFCYFNNYSLTQPRHFCKTCRRYWTRGGALRKVPVGGGSRRNKRSKGSNRSKSSERDQTGSGTLASNSCTDMLGHVNPSGAEQMPLLPPLHHLGDYNSDDTGLNFEAIQAATGGVANMDFQIGTIESVEQWRSLQQVQQFPFLTSLEHTQTGSYRFESEGVEPPSHGGHHRLQSKHPYLGASATNSWTDLSGFIKEKSSHR